MEKATKQIVWKIGNKQYDDQELSFYENLQRNFCLFSGPVNKLFTDYKIHSVTSSKNKVVALPKEDIRNFRLPDEAVKPAGVYLIPSRAANDENKGLRIAYKSSKTGKIKAVSFKKGMQVLSDTFGKKGKFLPVIINNELKSGENSNPVIRLHRIDLNALTLHSDLEKQEIESALEERLNRLIA